MPRMYHDDPMMTGGPTTADVPDEAVPWMQKSGWYLKQDTPQEKPAEKAAKTETAPASTAKR